MGGHGQEVLLQLLVFCFPAVRDGARALSLFRTTLTGGPSVGV